MIGNLLEAGDVLRPTDVYESTSGDWEPCPCPGLPIGEGVATRWVRPAPVVAFADGPEDA